MPDTRILGQVLLIDDDDAVRRFFVRVLTRAGFDVAEAGDGPDGIARIAEHLPSVVVLDNRMPGMSGLEVLTKLRGDPRTRTLPVILVTAEGDVEERVEGLGAGADDYHEARPPRRARGPRASADARPGGLA
jgi:DNA-binding response OmpR family regulator